MNKLKLGVTDTHPHLAQFFLSLLSTRYNIVPVNLEKEIPEILLFGDNNFGNTNARFSKKDCTKLLYTGENQRPTDYDCDYAISFDHNFEPWHYRMPLYVIYMWALKHIHNTKYDYYYIFNPDVQDKTDFCSFVVSNPKCEERNNFFNLLSSYKKVDSAGKLYNNVNINLAGEQAKIDFLSSRKFNICFEPESHPGYVTEKILHAFYSGTVPIYWGSETISNDFNPASFINVHDFRSQEEAIEYIIKVDQDDDLYFDYINAPKFLNNIPPSYIFLDNFLNWFDSTVYTKINKR